MRAALRASALTRRALRALSYTAAPLRALYAAPLIRVLSPGDGKRSSRWRLFYGALRAFALGARCCGTLRALRAHRLASRSQNATAYKRREGAAAGGAAGGG